MIGRPQRPQLEKSESPIQRNIEAIVKLEESFVKDRTAADRVADWIANFSGSLKFVVIHVVIYGAWILINTGFIPVMRRFDPFPFLLLSVVVSLEAIFLSTFVLIKQNRMQASRSARPSRSADQPARRARNDARFADAAKDYDATGRSGPRRTDRAIR